VPMLIAMFMAILFKSTYCSDGNVNYLLAWIVIGIPFGIKKMCAWIIPYGHDLAATIGIIFLNVIIGGLIGGVVFMWQMVRGIVKMIHG